jgi:hypothetical protein
VCCTKYINDFFTTHHILSSLRRTKSLFNFKKISPITTLKQLLKLDPKSAPSICGIETEIFVYCADLLAKPLNELFNGVWILIVCLMNRKLLSLPQFIKEKALNPF